MQTLRLNEAAVNHYHEQGYFLFHKPVFSLPKFDKLNTMFEEIVSRKETGMRTDELDKPHFYEPRLFEFLMADEVLDLVEPLLGPNIGLWSSHFIAKEPLVGRATPWHEDSAYWKGRLDRMDQIVTVWLALDKTDRENGCMRVIPGSHELGGFSDYEGVDASTNLFDTAIRADQIDESRSVYFELAPNECSLHDGRIIHGAEANTSPRHRAGYTMRYFSMETRFIADAAGNEGHDLYLCRGENVANNSIKPIPNWD